MIVVKLTINIIEYIRITDYMFDFLKMNSCFWHRQYYYKVSAFDWSLSVSVYCISLSLMHSTKM